MIAILQNQHVCKRKKLHWRVIKKRHVKDIQTKSISSFMVKPGYMKKNRRILISPVITGIVIFLFCILISSPHIFSLTMSQFSARTRILPEESNLDGFPDGYDFVDNLPDEREYGIIRIKNNKTINQKPIPTHYIVKKGDSVFSISKQYSISLFNLLRENRITDPTKLRIGDVIKFPESSLDSHNKPAAVGSDNTLRKEISISADKKSGFAPLKIKLKLDTDISANHTAPEFSAENSKETFTYMWVLGNDRYLFNNTAEFIYTAPGDYNVFLIISDKRNNEIVSNTINIQVKKKNTRKLHIETKDQQFITVNQINEILKLSHLTGLDDMTLNKSDIHIKQSQPLFQNIGDGELLSIKPGFTNLTITADNKRFVSHIFISPIPSKHAYEPPYNWYKTQFGTGINGNCGPASVAMAIYWVTGEDISVAKVRSEIGMPFANGAIHFSHMLPSFRKHNVKTRYIYPQKFSALKNIIDQGNIAIVLFNTRYISKTNGDARQNFIGRYYLDTVGHYCIVKGYTLDGKYLIVYDPIPSDWSGNKERYADGISMIGRNRYYPVSELYNTMKKKVLEILR